MYKHLSLAELQQKLDYILQSPANQGILEMIVRRPEVDKREILTEGILDLTEGLVGDRWVVRARKGTTGQTVDTGRQLTLMNARIIAVLAQDKSRWPLAGDQFYIDIDMSEQNMPPGTRLAVGSSIIEVTSLPHLGCKKFAQRYGDDAMMFVNSPQGKELHLRGLNARVIQPGTIHTGDIVHKL